ncbi:MAG TPA: lycopene cyclase [Cytophagales bacterium]|nr:lycopene cyclase [Cytophagales bacterium]HAA22304.1 lycopene cyclase [Cytophagales bacterium]HAP60483.1 lycopene cyclase [Cytophagales bacterium]
MTSSNTSGLHHFDVIIAGTGAAGLSLAYAISQSEKLKDLQVLLVDKEQKGTNDRTWCFWEEGEGTFDDILHHVWDRAQFYGNNFEKELDLSPYRYKMIRSEDFYQKIIQTLTNQDNFTWVQEPIQEIKDQPDRASLTTKSGVTYTGQWLFNSTPFGSPSPNKEKYNYLLQHFKGYEITAHRPVFSPGLPTFMDFRVEQGDANDARFGYILPDNEQEALVEYTVFSPETWSQEAYEEELQGYLKRFVNLDPDEYTVRRVEFGVIPMTDQYFPPSQGKHVIQIGTFGGQTKASTGYTFQRIQKHTQRIMNQWEKKGTPLVKSSRWNRRFTFYDAVLLEVMQKEWVKSRDIFTRIFKRNPEIRVFRFLDDSTDFREEVALMNSMPYLPFLRAVASKLFKYTFR